MGISWVEKLQPALQRITLEEVIRIMIINIIWRYDTIIEQTR